MLVLHPGGVAFLMMLIKILPLLAIIGMCQWRRIAVFLHAIVTFAATVIWIFVELPNQRVFGLVSMLLIVLVVPFEGDKTAWKKRPSV